MQPDRFYMWQTSRRHCIIHPDLSGGTLPLRRSLAICECRCIGKGGELYPLLVSFDGSSNVEWPHYHLSQSREHVLAPISFKAAAVGQRIRVDPVSDRMATSMETNTITVKVSESEFMKKEEARRSAPS